MPRSSTWSSLGSQTNPWPVAHVATFATRGTSSGQENSTSSSSQPSLQQKCCNVDKGASICQHASSVSTVALGKSTVGGSVAEGLPPSKVRRCAGVGQLKPGNSFGELRPYHNDLTRFFLFSALCIPEAGANLHCATRCDGQGCGECSLLLCFACWLTPCECEGRGRFRTLGH